MAASGPAPELFARSVIETAEARGREIVAAAEADAARLTDEARRQVQDLSRQIDALISLREQLKAGTAASIGDPSVDGEATAAGPAGPVATAGPLATNGPVATANPVAATYRPGDVAVAEAPASTRPIIVASASPLVAGPVASPPMTSALPVAAPLTAPGSFGSLTGVVTVTVGPFADTEAIEQFERALVTIAELDDVYLRAYESGRAIFELTLHRPAALVHELSRVSLGPVTVVQESPRALVISLGDPIPGGRAQP